MIPLIGLYAGDVHGRSYVPNWHLPNVVFKLPKELFANYNNKSILIIIIRITITIARVRVSKTNSGKEDHAARDELVFIE